MSYEAEYKQKLTTEFRRLGRLRLVREYTGGT